MRNASLWRGVLGVEKAVVEELDFDPVERVLIAQCVTETAREPAVRAVPATSFAV